MNRRDFIRNAPRGLIVAGAAVWFVFEEAKRRRLDDDPNCRRLSPCADCGEFGRCRLPKAVLTKRSNRS